MKRSCVSLTRIMISSIESTMHDTLRIIFEDEWLIAVNKPHGMLSVPGIDANDGRTSSTRFRHLQWKESVISAAQCLHTDIHLRPILMTLSGFNDCPRRRPKFDTFLKNRLKIVDPEMITAIWNTIVAIDTAMHKSKLNLLPRNRISASHIVENYCKTTIYNVHRLDQETSGALMFAKTADACSILNKKFRDCEISKIYQAIVAHNVSPTLTCIDLAIMPDLSNRPKQIVDEVNGKASTTLVEIAPNAGSVKGCAPPSGCSASGIGCDSDGDKCAVQTTLVHLTPLSGRTHQLRVHMSHMGHPILGDTIYASPEIMALSPRLYLHAWKISFKHPITQELISIEAPCEFDC